MRCVALMFAVVLTASSCNTSPPPAVAAVPAALQELTDAHRAVVDRFDRLSALHELVKESDAPELREERTRLAREAAQLLSRSEFAHLPLAQSEFRTRVLFLASDLAAEREAALIRCRELLKFFTSKASPVETG